MESAVGAMPAAAPPDVPAELNGAAIACLQRAFAGCDERAAALHLLAADALMTSACEAAAGVDSADAAGAAAALDAMCASVSLRRLSLLLPGNDHDDVAMSAGSEQAREQRHE
jgi:hypothetical protein